MSSYKKFLFMVLPGPKSSFHGIPLHGIPIHEIALCGILVHEILMRSLFVEFLFMKVQHFHVFLKRKFKETTIGGNLISLYTVWQLCMEPLTAPEV